MEHLKFTLFSIMLAFLLTGCVARYPKGANYIISDYLSSTGVNGGTRSERHKGIDFGGKIGTPILAAADGLVVMSGDTLPGGKTVIIDHGQDSDGSYIKSEYVHNDKNLVNEGDRVKRGQKIAELGVTGRNSGGIPHLHFEVKRVDVSEGGFWKHINPRNYFMKDQLDPKKIIVCFDQNESYPTLPIKFTHPVECSSNKNFGG